MASYFNGNGGNGDHRRQYFCHHCNNIFSSRFDSGPSTYLTCPNCNGDSIAELQTPNPISPTFINSPFSNMPPEIVAAFAATPGGVSTVNMSIPAAPVFCQGKPIGVANPASATFQMPVSGFTNGNFEQLMGQFLTNSLLSSFGGAPPMAPTSEIGGNQNSESEEEEEEEDLD